MDSKNSLKKSGNQYFLRYFVDCGKQELPGFVCLIVVLLIVCSYLFDSPIRGIFRTPDLNDYGYTEFLINFETGFVRRGLLGEMLYQICLIIGIAPQYIIQPLCLSAFLFVIIYFFYRFYKLDLNWWIIASPFLCGFVSCIIRKDYILYSLLITMFLLLRNIDGHKFRLIGVALLATLGLFLHEAFIFWGIPIVLLYLIADKSTRKTGIIMGIFLCLIFILLSIFKGSETQAHGIIRTWGVIPGCESLEYKVNNSIGALGWSMEHALTAHMTTNFGGKSTAWLVVPLRILFLIVAYYFLSNFLFTFKGNNTDCVESDKTSLSALLLFSFICLLPMYIFLSCDWGRLDQYVCISAFGAYITLPKAKISRIFPRCVFSKVASFNSFLNRIVKPRPWLMVILLLVLAEAPVGFSYQHAMCETIFWPAYMYIKIHSEQLFHHLMTLF